MTGAELRELRKDRKLSLDELGKLLGISRQAVFQLEQREQLSPATESSVRVALAGFDGVEIPKLRPLPLDCPVCGHACDTGPASPAYVLGEHLRSAHAERSGQLRTPGASVVDRMVPAFRLEWADPGYRGPSTQGLTACVVFADHPVVALTLPLRGEIAYQWIPGSVREEGTAQA